MHTPTYILSNALNLDTAPGPTLSLMAVTTATTIIPWLREAEMA